MILEVYSKIPSNFNIYSKYVRYASLFFTFSFIYYTAPDFPEEYFPWTCPGKRGHLPSRFVRAKLLFFFKFRLIVFKMFEFLALI